MAKKGQAFKRYSEEFKLRALDMYEQGEMSYRAIAKTRFTIINQLRKNLLSVSQKKISFKPLKNTVGFITMYGFVQLIQRI